MQIEVIAVEKPKVRKKPQRVSKPHNSKIRYMRKRKHRKKEEE